MWKKIIDIKSLEQLLETYETVYEQRYTYHYEEFFDTQSEAELWGKIEMLRFIISHRQFRVGEHYRSIINC